MIHQQVFARDALGQERDNQSASGSAFERYIDDVHRAFVVVKDRFVGYDLSRVEAFFASLRATEKAVQDPRQKPNVSYFPGLRAKPWWSAQDGMALSVVARTLEGAYADIRAELVSVLERDAPFVRNPTTDRYTEALGEKDWTVCLFRAHGERVPETARLFPRTSEVVRQLEHFLIPPGKAGFIALGPGVHLPLHADATNAQLTCHLPLVVPGDCALSVAEDKRRWVEGKAVFFDHCYEHEAWNNSASIRYMLYLSVVQPDMRPEELAAWEMVYTMVRFKS